jgi:peptidoglycan/xylan/chitin deacetylase (PgdA/CDA1 family)
MATFRSFGLCGVLFSALVFLASTPAAASPCDGRAGGLGVARVVEIDASSGPLYGDLTKYQRQADFLKAKEVVLTFDDGPMPWITKSILETLDRFCTKATFFSVGRMAMAYPDMVKAVVERGHTLGTHTWSHPMNIRALGADGSVNEIEKGFAAVAAAAGRPIAPFFRFPGLGDTGPLLTHLQTRGVATFTVDVVSNDSYIGSTDRLIRETLAKVDARQGGIILFHDIKAVTARALPDLLAELARRGYRVVHMTSKHAFEPDARLHAAFDSQIARSEARSGRRPPTFYGAAVASGDAPVVPLTPARVSYSSPAAQQQAALRRVGRPEVASSDPSQWVTTVRRSQRLRAPSLN